MPVARGDAEIARTGTPAGQRALEIIPFLVDRLQAIIVPGGSSQRRGALRRHAPRTRPGS
jgi:hypothetical protein